MFNDYGFREPFDNDIDISITNENYNTNYNDNFNANMNMMGGYSEPVMSNVQSPIIEPGRERVVNRTFVHNVPQVSPFM